MRHDDLGGIEQIGEVQRNRTRGITEQHAPSLPASPPPHAAQVAGLAARDSVQISDEAHQQLHGRVYDDTPSVTALTQALRAMIHERASASPLLSV